MNVMYRHMGKAVFQRLGEVSFNAEELTVV